MDQTCDRLHETGLIGSLRWWYEALVRGLGGYACDPTSEERCEFDTKAYEQAKKDGKPEAEAINAGLCSVCPVCYLFGATGWARLFQLRAVEIPMTPLHFRTTLSTNQGWLKRVFGGENQNIDSLKVPYGDLCFQFIPRRQDTEYAKNQFALILRVAAEYGGIGARLQHGFGQFVFPPDLSDVSMAYCLNQLQAKIQDGVLRFNERAFGTPFNLKNFVSLIFEIPANTLNDFMTDTAHIGAPQKREEKRYIPCTFDLRYKGKGNLGLRQWLKGKGWKETTNPTNLEELDLLLGPRSQWGMKGKQQQIDDEFRTAGRVFFGMPYQKQEDKNVYVLRAWAFWPSELQPRLSGVQALKTLLEDYMQHAFDQLAQKVSEAVGKDILAQAAGGIR
ncbi:MAG: type III-B CRISPR module RAMP protein Cmr1 [Chloroflexi bacterium]|nr:type III-B CRISPR module RAMP protein Cmr1 [Chloroflexota bacterium]